MIYPVSAGQRRDKYVEYIKSEKARVRPEEEAHVKNTTIEK